MADTDPTAALEEIRERRRFFDETGEEASAKMMAWALGQSAADVFPLLAAVEAVLKLTEPRKQRDYDLDGNWEGPVQVVIPAEMVREAITRELTGKEDNHAR